jgi:hypothetical protein
MVRLNHGNYIISLMKGDRGMEIEGLMEFIEESIWVNQDEYELDTVESITTFEDAMLLTGNKGLIIKCQDGSEFQVTIVKSK